MIEIEEAYEILFANVKPGPVVAVPLEDALFRTLANPICCDVDHPPFDRSVMDGYAVRAADLVETPVTLRVVGRIAAGAQPDRALASGEAIQINTGAPIPPGADAVVRVELTQCSGDGNSVAIHEAVEPGRFITRRATYVSAGTTVLAAGTRMTPAAMGTAASAGASRVTVYRRPTVAVLTTGDELIDIDRTPTGARIRDSNRFLLAALIAAAHAEPILLGAVRDDRPALQERIVEGLRSDVLCVTGGVSMGAFDFVPEVLESCGARFHVRKIAIKPGRPTIFATGPEGTLIFGLPGNPGGAFVGFELLVRPALSALEGRVGVVPPRVRAVLRGCLSGTTNRRSYWPARLHAHEEHGWEVEPLPWHGSGDSFGLATADALITRPREAGAAGDGDRVSAIPLEWA